MTEKTCPELMAVLNYLLQKITTAQFRCFVYCKPTEFNSTMFMLMCNLYTDIQIKTMSNCNLKIGIDIGMKGYTLSYFFLKTNMG